MTKKRKSTTNSHKRFSIIIKPDGTLSAIYSDDLVSLMDEGEAVINRASHVEPNGKGQWIADLKPVNGPILGPFKYREAALQAEVNWLTENMFD